MPDHKPKSSQGNLNPNQEGLRPADQAEGERGNDTSVKVGRTPDQAEGEREDVEESSGKSESQNKK